MHERRLLWAPVPRCPRCGRILATLVPGIDVSCERCLTVKGDITPDTPAMVTTAFQRLGEGQVNAHVVSSSARGQRGWSVLRITPSFGADVELFALAGSAIPEAVRVVLAGISTTARVSDVRTGRTLVIDAA